MKKQMNIDSYVRVTTHRSIKHGVINEGLERVDNGSTEIPNISGRRNSENDPKQPFTTHLFLFPSGHSTSAFHSIQLDLNQIIFNRLGLRLALRQGRPYILV